MTKKNSTPRGIMGPQFNASCSANARAGVPTLCEQLFGRDLSCEPYDTLADAFLGSGLMISPDCLILSDGSSTCPRRNKKK